MQPFYYKRPALAQRLVSDLTGANPFSDAPNGLFLASGGSGLRRRRRPPARPRLERRRRPARRHMTAKRPSAIGASPNSQAGLARLCFAHR